MKNKFCPRWDSNQRFSQFTLFYRVKCENLFRKTNIKLKVLKLNKTKKFQILDDIKLIRFDLHWLIESIPEGFWSLFSMPYGIWRVSLWRNILNLVMFIIISLINSLVIFSRPSKGEKTMLGTRLPS